MTVIDLAHVCGAMYLVWVFRRRRRALEALGALTAMRLVLAGLLVIATFYALDLLSMHLLPHLFDRALAMALMRDLHLNWAWLSTALSVGLMGTGLVQLMRVLMPKAEASIASLKRLAAERETAVTLANQKLQVEREEFRIMSERTSFDDECRLRTRSGEYRWFQLSGRASWDDGGAVTRMAGSIRDITERRRIAERMHELELAIESAMTGISRLDSQRRFAEVREAYARMLGYEDPAELEGRSWSMTVAADDVESARRSYQQMMECGRAQALVRVLRKDGSEFVKELLLVKIVNEGGRHDGHFCFMRDVTAEHALTEQLSHQAMHDALTGLVNRAELETRIQRVLESARASPGHGGSRRR